MKSATGLPIWGVIARVGIPDSMAGQNTQIGAGVQWAEDLRTTGNLASGGPRHVAARVLTQSRRLPT
jgi:hypothetical protein